MLNQDYFVYKIDRRMGEVKCVLVFYRTASPHDPGDRNFMNKEILRYAGHSCGKCGKTLEEPWDGNKC